MADLLGDTVALNAGAPTPALVGASDERPLSPALAALVDDAEEFRRRARAPSTRRAYASDWADFTVWCAQHGAVPLPADPRVVALYLTDRAASKKAATLQRRLSAVQHYHREAGFQFDTQHATLGDVWTGIRRTLGVAPTSKAPTVTEELRELLSVLSASSLPGLRDRALLLLGFAGCFRRSEVAGLTTDAVVLEREGLVITLASSKTDQLGAGIVKGVPYGRVEGTCPVRAYRAWVAAAGITDGPIFRSVDRHGRVLPGALSDRAVALVVKRAVSAARDAALARGNTVLADHFDPARYAGHSLRSGFLTSGAEAGVSLKELMDQAAHVRADTTLRYIKRAGVFRQNAASKVGL